MLTPAQAEAALKKAGRKPAEAKELIEKLSVWSKPGVALAPNSSPKPAIKSSAAQAFAEEPEDDFLDI